MFTVPSKAPIRQLGKIHNFISQDHEEHIVSIIGSLMRNLSGKMKDRLVQKFVELDHAKTDRLLELHFKYMDKMDEADEDIAKTAKMLANEGQAMDEEMVYIQKMELGLFTLQQVCTNTNTYK